MTCIVKDVFEISTIMCADKIFHLFLLFYFNVFLFVFHWIIICCYTCFNIRKFYLNKWLIKCLTSLKKYFFFIFFKLVSIREREIKKKSISEFFLASFSGVLRPSYPLIYKIPFSFSPHKKIIFPLPFFSVVIFLNCYIERSSLNFQYKKWL